MARSVASVRGQPEVEGAAVPQLGASESYPIVVHSHLRWSFVWQRPQQTHSRLARRHPVLFVEEPVPAPDGVAHLALSAPWPGVTVAQPALPVLESSAAPERIDALLREALAGPLGRRYAAAVHWLYTPLMEPQIDSFGDPSAVVYDCMDELSAFAFAPEGLASRERRLLARADVVFTGGHALYDAKRGLHRNVHAFGCGVDLEHFASAASAELPDDVRGLPAPRFGYVGVVDERLDYGLLRRIAEEHPRASVVVVGPVVKVDPASLPRLPNVHYLGARPYSSLPGYLAAFDVCLMPFALNDATRFINPTKTLEYLATGKPVVSTPIADVVRTFSDAVHVAPSHQVPDLLRRILAGDRLSPDVGLEAARRSSWERIVTEMESLASAARSQGAARAPRLVAESS